MQTEKLAEQLVSLNKISEIKSFIKKQNHQVGDELAFALKEICYAAWTNEPTKAQKASQVLEVLAQLNPGEKIKALSEWIGGIAFITEGKIECAVEKLNRANEIFLQIGEEHLAAQTQVSKLYSLALLGHYEEAVDCGNKTLKIFDKFGDELAAGKIEHNLGNIFMRREEYQKSEEYLRSARVRFDRLRDVKQLTMAENALAIILFLQNKFREAEKMYTKALWQATESEMIVTQAEIEASMGNLYLFRAKFDQALKFLELSRQKYENLKMPHQMAVAELEIADAYLELNLVAEAFDIYEKVTELLSELKMQGEEARARVNFARAAINLRKNELAQSQLRKAAALYKAEKNLTGEAFVKLIETQLDFSLHNYQKAFELAEETAAMLQKSGNLRHVLLLKYLQGEILLNLKKFDEAEKLFREIYIKATKQDNSFLAQAAQTSLGKLALEQNKEIQAEKHFKKAINLIENLREPLPAEDFRMSFFADKLLAYQQLAHIYLKKGKVKDAFLLVEQSRSRVLAESLTGNAKFEASQTEVSAPLLKKLKDLREELNWFYSRLNRATPDETKSLLPETQTREKEINELMRQIKSVGGESHKTNKPLDLKNLQNSLGKERVLLEYVNFGDKINVFILTEKSVDFVEINANEKEFSQLLEGLHFQFETMRYGEAKLGSFTTELKRRADFYLQNLYQKLIEPIEKFIENRHLVIIPFGKLHYLPFHALFDGTNYLIEKREVSYAASATVLQYCLEKPKRALKNALLVGFADEKIPFVKEEIDTLKTIFPNHKSLVEKEATFAKFKKHAEQFDIIHLACHGQFRQDNPMFSALRLADGFLTVRDISELNLKAGLITLSACETGLNKVLSGDELIGLKRGFFAAGASSVVLTLWTVSDKATQSLMAEFYQNLQTNKTISQSLRTAQGNLIKQKKHPYFWSPFFLAGSW